MSTTTDDNGNSMPCANCGKEGNNLNSCNKCKLVKYCNAACKKKHRSKHKKKCDRRVAELHDDALFKQPPTEDECPICFMRMPSMDMGWKYNTCCGKIICSGCIYAGGNMEGNVDQLCPFCRAPTPYLKEVVERVKKRVQVDDAHGIYELAWYYAEGMHGLPQDRDKALELWHQAGELGYAGAFNNIGSFYGFERNEKKAKHYWELAAIGGAVDARCNLGISEGNKGNYDRALKHYMIAVEGGNNESLKRIQKMCKDGHATTDHYAKALQAYQAYLDEIKSDDRDKAAAYSDRFKYYE